MGHQINIGFTFLELFIFIISLSLSVTPLCISDTAVVGKMIYRLMRQRVSLCDTTVDKRHEMNFGALWDKRYSCIRNETSFFEVLACMYSTETDCCRWTWKSVLGKLFNSVAKHQRPQSWVPQPDFYLHTSLVLLSHWRSSTSYILYST